MADLEIRGGEDFQKFANALREAADKELNKAVGKALREVAKPMGERVVRAGADRMPRRGGMAALVSAARVGVRFSKGRNPGVQLQLSDKSKHDLRSLDRGILRHPVFGDRQVWRSQKVPADAFSDEFAKEAPDAAQAALKAMQKVADDISRRV
jgi:hypothetical protein